MRSGFAELNAPEQQVHLEEFRSALKAASHQQVLKRFDESGWQHRMVLGSFIRFYAERVLGDQWDKPTVDDILAIAAESASVPKRGSA